ncbi:FecR domain-containing protein [Methylopila sp. M107]|uniref:FecR family protein n=1 Tax=Methylopila sp. M107 TaxID=1101190 RepID=UPI00036BC8D7|nr:FecR domain-containing protein [Methylopila sp. M107]
MSDLDAPTERAAREATAWFVRLNDPIASEADRRAFGDWLAADPAHAKAFAEVEALWRMLDRPAAVMAADLAADERRRAAPRRGASVLGRRVAALATAAAVAVAVVLWRDPGLATRALADHATRPGETREVSLPDGTALFLDGDSAVNRSLVGDLREVTVLRGRVWFDVAHETSRPFVVHADDLDVRVTGTAFGVDGDRGVVTVERGSVTVAEAGETFHLTSGQQASVVAGRLQVPEAVDPETALAWRRGLIVLDAAPLDDVFRELGRMAGGRVIAPQAEVRGMKLSGVFRAGDPDALVEAMRRGLGLKVFEAPGLGTVVYR